MNAKSNKQVLTVNTEQAKRIIALCWKAQGIARKSRIPVTTGVALVGPTGTAKSSTEAADALDLFGVK